MKQLARVTALIVLTIGLVVMLWIFSSAVLLFLLSLVIAAAVRPMALRLIERRFPRAAAYSLTYLGLILLVVAIMALVTVPLVSELRQASDELLITYGSARATWPQGTAIQQQIAAMMPTSQELVNVLAGPRGTAFLSSIVGIGSGVFDILAQGVVAISLSVYWASDQQRFERLWLSLISPHLRTRARALWHGVESEVGAYVRSEMTQSVLAGVTLGFVYNGIGLKFPVMLALWAAITWLVPWVGVLLALIPAVIVAWASGPVAIGLTAASTIAVFALMEIWVEPRLYGRNRVSPVLVVILLMVLAQHAGILGMLLAPPLAAAIQIFTNQLWAMATAPATEPMLAHQVQGLEVRLDTIQTTLENDEQGPNQQMQGLIRQTRELIGNAQATLTEQQTPQRNQRSR